MLRVLCQFLPRSLNGTKVDRLNNVALHRAVRCCTWAGKWAFKPWPNNYIVPVEDPFDATDNCARSIFASNTGLVKDAFLLGLLSLRDLSSQAGKILSTPNACSPTLHQEGIRLQLRQEVVCAAADGSLNALFTARPPPAIKHPFKSGARWQEGWNRDGRTGHAAIGAKAWRGAKDPPRSKSRSRRQKKAKRPRSAASASDAEQ